MIMKGKEKGEEEIVVDNDDNGKVQGFEIEEKRGRLAEGGVCVGGETEAETERKRER